MALTGKVIRDAVKDLSDSQEIADALAKAIIENLEVKIMPGDVIIAVSGGSGAPAIGVPNPNPIDCEIKQFNK